MEPVKTAREMETTVAELTERLEMVESTLADIMPFVLQMRMTIAQLAQNPMVLAIVPPQFRAELSRYLPPKD